MDRPARSMSMDIVGRGSLGGNRYQVTIAASEKVRQPPDLDFEGLSFDNYMRNPVVMWAHDAVGLSPSGGLPIGRTLKLERTADGGMVAEFEFLDDDPFAQRVKNAWDRGFLQAASISWVPTESVPIGSGRWRDVQSELLEWSVVSVPADPGALREAHARMLDSFLGADGWGQEESESGHGSPTNGERREAAQPEPLGLALLPDDYDDLSMALALIRDVVDGGGHVRDQSQVERGDADLEEIGRAVKETRRSLGKS